MSTPVQLVWFKRDLRIKDHAPLVAAALAGRVLPLYVVEPDIIGAADYDAMHYRFVRDGLVELRAALAELGQPLVVRVGEAVEVLRALHEQTRFEVIHTHEETGNALTYARDIAVLDWARAVNVRVCETPQTGVVRRLGSRNGWSAIWGKRMKLPVLNAPDVLAGLSGVDAGRIPDAQALGLQDLHPAVSARQQRQRGGAAEAHATLQSFLAERGQRYHREMSAPGTAWRSCSRLSAYLATGAISMREVVQRARADERLPRRAASAFMSRLHWHCHFMQKLESQPSIEHRCFNAAYEGLRNGGNAESLYEAWCTGRTGFPFVDACMRSLQATGWINFRMRAMLVSFAAYDLWLDWRLFRDVLARQFIDYEPGIHISQIQMQSGTTGINTPRMYNPIKQGWDHDANGDFIRRWVPELANVPAPFVHEPWKLTPMEAEAAGLALGVDYPERVVDHAASVREARQRIGAVRRSAEHRGEAERVFEQHGSRKSSRDRMSNGTYRKRRTGGSDAPRFDAPNEDDNQRDLFD
ncbi:MAG: deoxyribodipyrimidine photo-lyase [Pseudomonadota bacterium]